MLATTLDIMMRTGRGGLIPRPALPQRTLLEARPVMAAHQDTTSKRCIKCDLVKPVMQFSPSASYGDGYCSDCRECRNRIRRERNAERIRLQPDPVLPPDPYADDPWSWAFVLFRPIPDLWGYALDTDGNVWSCRSYSGRLASFWKKLNPSKTFGYITATFQVGQGTKASFRVHRLMAEVFLGGKHDEMNALHADGRRDNNHIVNIRWGTQKENYEDSVKHGTYCHGETHGLSLLTDQQVREIYHLLNAGVPRSELASRFGVSRSTISIIAVGKGWVHVRDAVGVCVPKANRGQHHPKAKLSEADVMRIIELKHEGWSSGKIALQYGVDRSTVKSILNGKSWKCLLR